MSLYTLDGTTRNLLRLERFGEANFSVRTFVEQLSGAQRHLDDDNRLDPKPYIRTFECAATELERLHEIALSQEKAACEAVAELTELRNLEIQDLVGNVQECMLEVKALDDVTTDISQITGPVSQSLERISHQHAQISDYRALISAYLSFLHEKQPSELTRLWQTDVRKCAHFVSQLQKLATAVGPLEGLPDVQKQVDKYAENLENQLLSNFLESYQNFDLPGMREGADVLFEFNGGSSVVQAYINQHKFFMNVDQMELQQKRENETAKSEMLWKHLRNHGDDYSEFSEAVEKSVREITDTIARETEIIIKVFSRPAQVASIFIQRTLAQKIQALVTNYMEIAADQPQALAQLRVLSVCYTKVNELVTDLQKLWGSPKSGLSDAEQTELGAVLESNFMDAFVLYLEDYFALEQRSLTEIIDLELGVVKPSTRGDIKRSPSVFSSTSGNEDGRMERIRRAVRKFRSDEWGGGVEDVTEPGEEVNNDSINTASLRFSHHSDDNAPGSPRSLKTAQRGSGFAWLGDTMKNVSMQNILNVLAVFGEAISREQILRPPHLFASDATTFYNLLTREVGSRFISAVIDDTLNMSYKCDPKSPIDFTFLESIRVSGHSLRLVSAFVKTVLFAMVRSAPEPQQNMADALNMYITNVQGSCRELVEQAMDLMHLRTRALFSKNTKRDFMEPTNDGVLSSKLYDEFHNLAENAKESLSHENCHRLLTNIAVNFCDDLLQHISQFTISVAGGNALSNDVAEYERLMTQDWGLSGEVAEKFATLRAISRLYIADQSLLSSLLRDSHLSKLTPSQLRLYLSQRADNNAKIMSMLYLHNNLQYKGWY